MLLATVMKKRSSFVVPLSLMITLGILGLCGWFVVIQPIGKALCLIRPDSLRNPPILPNAKNIQFGKSSFTPQQGDVGKLVQFETSDSPASVYKFYAASLGQDGWLEDDAQYVTTDPGRIDAKFDWLCSLESANYFATLWFHSEVVTSGKTVVTLNFEYVP